MSRPLRISDLPMPACKHELIGRVYPCPFHDCGAMVDIGSEGITHFGHRHMLRIDLNELFTLATVTYPKWREMERKMLFGE